MALLTRAFTAVRQNKGKTLLLTGAVVTVTAGPLYVYTNEVNLRLVGSAIYRTSRAGWAVCKAASRYKVSMYRMSEESEGYKEHCSAVHTKTAQTLCDLCRANGGIFIKIGQHIGALDLLLPKEYVHVFKTLHSEAPSSSLESVHTVLETELGMPANEIFKEFDSEPIGSASLAQVHRAVLHSGKEVAVKVQHSTVQGHSKVDTVTIEFLAKLIDKIFPEFEFDWLIATIKRNLPKELDFENEAKNAEHAARLFDDVPFLKIPKIHWATTNKRVLTMEFCRGGKIDDVQYYKDNKISENQVLSYLSKLFSQMIFTRGYIHCDPHPGNILINKEEGQTQIILLDHGLYQTITDDFRVTYCKLWQALLKGDESGIQKQATKLGVGQYHRLFACMVAARTFDDIADSGVGHTETVDITRIQQQAVANIPQISQVLQNVPRDLILILKTNDLLRGIEATLLRKNTQGLGTFLNMARYCVSSLCTHKLSKKRGVLQRVVIYCSYYRVLCRIKFFRFLYWLSLTSLGSHMKHLLPSNVFSS